MWSYEPDQMIMLFRAPCENAEKRIAATLLSRLDSAQPAKRSIRN
jgi:hypothetical protein